MTAPSRLPGEGPERTGGPGTASRAALRVLGAWSFESDGRGDERATGQRIPQSGDEVGGEPALEDVPEAPAARAART